MKSVEPGSPNGKLDFLGNYVSQIKERDPYLLDYFLSEAKTKGLYNSVRAKSISQESLKFINRAYS